MKSIKPHWLVFHSATTPGEVNPGVVLTLVLWLVCLQIGVLGFTLPYTRPSPPTAAPEPIIAEPLQVELTAEPEPPSQGYTTEAFTDYEIIPPEIIPPEPMAVAEPTTIPAFPLPTETPPTRVHEVHHASHAPPPAANTAALATPAVQTVTPNGKNGTRPPPKYPLAAREQGQEGTVVVRLTVDESGRVIAAEVCSPSPWPLLNESAERVVRERWRFPKGSSQRLYEVAFCFKLER